ncbi:anthranilate synthase component I family protein [Rathayibacter toxicus]|nr:anthranilate synthase component I family protein [Rathayibacter toxicus]
MIVAAWASQRAWRPLMADRNPRSEPWENRVDSQPLRVSSEALFQELYSDLDEAVWLDSARASYGMGRFSIMGAPGEDDPHISYSADRREVSECGTVVAREINLWSWLADRIDRNPTPPLPYEIPFAGGFVGYAGYGTDGGVPVPRSDPHGPDAEFIHLSRYVVIDHEKLCVHVVAVVPPTMVAGATAWVAAIAARIADLCAEPAPPAAAPTSLLPARMSVDRDRYLADLVVVREWLLAGDSYEACYTYQLTGELDGSSLDAYRRLRRNNPAPYGAYLCFGVRRVLSCSPERFLQVTSADWAETKPIKGTARRSVDPDQDVAIAKALALDPKTRSENLMIVDLVRNDLGLICAPGTVKVAKLMAVETYATVHQLVSSVTGKLEPRSGAAVHAAGALFPGGSMTGAPKLRTVALLDGLEATPRGVYSGCIGYVSRCGSADFSVVIRTAIVDGPTIRIGTGGAITVDSDAEAELDETIVKAQAMLAAFGYVHPLSGHAGSAITG